MFLVSRVCSIPGLSTCLASQVLLDVSQTAMAAHSKNALLQERMWFLEELLELKLGEKEKELFQLAQDKRKIEKTNTEICNKVSAYGMFAQARYQPSLEACRDMGLTLLFASRWSPSRRNSSCATARCTASRRSRCICQRRLWVAPLRRRNGRVICAERGSTAKMSWRCASL